jgi:hypothetical protein
MNNERSDFWLATIINHQTGRFVGKSQTLDFPAKTTDLMLQVNDKRYVGGFLRVLRFPPPIKQTATI